MHLDTGTMKHLSIIVMMLAGITVWVVALCLLLAVTRQLLDVLIYIMELAQLS